MANVIYKICTAAEWAEARRLGLYLGSEDDQKDGYVHFSTSEQLAETLAKHYGGQSDLLLIAFDPERFGPALRWETARGGKSFPHLYADPDPSLALTTAKLPLGADGTHVLPEGLN